MNAIKTFFKTLLLSKHFFQLSCLLFVFICGCTEQNVKKNPIHNESKGLDAEYLLKHAAGQLNLLKEVAFKENRIPRTVGKDGKLHWANPKFDWTEGFFPGSLWYMYKTTHDNKWKDAAESFQSMFESHKYYTSNHDLGFIFNTSYANGYEITKNEYFKDVMIIAADSLITRFNPKVGCIKSWDTDKGWQAERNWDFPVIIDNMMNLELLFKASQLTKNSKYKDIAIQHANTTLKNHFRDNHSSFHVVDYDAVSGTVRAKETAQGFANNSAWARGQAWGLYGYTVCYRYTKDIRFLEKAQHIANFILEKNKLQREKLPFWDYNASNIPNEPVDVSAAAISVSALLELDSYSDNSYKMEIEQLLHALSTEKYLSKIGDNHNFILKHSIGSIPHDNEIDVPLNYADYYYIEALVRYKQKYQK